MRGAPPGGTILRSLEALDTTAGAPRDRAPTLFLLDADPDLGRRLTAADRLLARRYALASLSVLPRGEWRPAARPAATALGYLVLDGALLRDVRLGARWSTELLGAEDVLRPWDDLEPPPGVRSECAWTVLEPVRLACLDGRFAAAAGRWPGMMDEILARTIRRTRVLTALRGLAGIPRLDARLCLLLRLLAERWGRVSHAGVALPIRLTHETIARLAGAQRPAVSAALGRLLAEGHLRRLPAGGWMLPLEPDGETGRLWSELRRGADGPGAGAYRGR